MNMNVEGKRVLVCGMARSGIAGGQAADQPWRACDHHGYKPEGEFGGALDELRTPECTFALGQSADGLIAGQDIMVISPGIAWAKPFVQNAIAQGVEVMGELELGRAADKGRACRHHRHERQGRRPRRWSASVSRDGTHDARRRKHRLSDYRDGGHIQTG